MIRVVKVKAEQLTESVFKPFGEVIYTFGEGHPELVKGGLREKDIVIEAVQLQQAHFAFHTDAGQSFYPSKNHPAVFMVGPVGQTLDHDDVRAFYTDGSKGVCMRIGVWHTVPISLVGDEIFKSLRGDSDYAAHSVEVDYDMEQGVTFEPDLRSLDN